MRAEHRHTPAGKLRARGAGIPFLGEPGDCNAITDVPGLEVGYCTLIEGEGPLVVGQGPVRTGITAIFPLGRARGTGPVYAGFFSMSGNGEMSGAHLIEERGRFEGPITITNTHSCGLARDATARWLTSQVDTELRPEPFWMPVAAETYDGWLNDVNGHHVKAEHVVAAFDDAHGGAIEEGSVGGGTGMSTYQFKGGSGTASRRLRLCGENYHVGAFVQSNFGKRHLMQIAGIPMGHLFPLERPVEPGRGSIIGVVATNAPLLPHQLKRLARRAAYGIARSGGIAANESGDLFLALSTANQHSIATHNGMVDTRFLGEGELSAVYEAAIQAVDEAIINAMVANETMTGRDGRQIPGLPLGQVQEILRQHGRLLDV
ncbi:MAG: P1 family peptidase [Halieaceae bacterium]|jgi:L-aminopeptidase/D-esterase-like protein|nr:P1 family peptidase [Halieaceae bacterium]